MSVKGNLPAQTFPEMVESGRERKATSKLYKAQSSEFVDTRLSSLISKTTAELTEVATSKPIGLRDIDEVKERTILYLRSCEEAATIPSITGLARALGMTRRALQICIERKSPAEAAEWLETCRDAFSDLLSESALRNDVNGIVSIFIQKAVYGLRESVEIVASQQPSVYGEQKSLEELAAIYDALPDDN